MSEFKGKIAVVTGAASGIGKAIAETFNQYGAKTVIIDRTPCQTDCDYFYQGDLTEKTVLQDFAAKTTELYGKVDFIVNNAGLSKGGIVSCSYDDFLYVQKLSLAAPFMLAKLFINNLNHNAAIVNISSCKGTISSIISTKPLFTGDA